MNGELIPLHLLPPGCSGRVCRIEINGAARRRMLDLGLTGSTAVAALQKSPSGDPTAYLIRGAVIALRSQEASQIFVAPDNIK
ncbi:MAG: ferrous iron transport protein A [Firmicutes bacterium]|nr:ferrous iron transport protein A [Bacillota bacterium]